MLEARPGVRVLFMSGYTNDVVMKERLLEGDITLIQKPFTPGELLQVVRRSLNEDPKGPPG